MEVASTAILFLQGGGIKKGVIEKGGGGRPGFSTDFHRFFHRLDKGF